MLRVMLDKRLVRRKQAGRAAEWSAAVSRDAAARSMVGKLVDGIFDGSAGLLVAHLVEGGKLSAEELAELRQMIDSSDKKTSRKGAKSRRKKEE
jgi:predicted transcriptional regulator